MIGQGLKSMHPDEGALWLQTTIQKHMSESIACKEITVWESSHPWLNNHVERAVQETAQAAPDERNAATHVLRQSKIFCFHAAYNGALVQRSWS